MKSFFKLIMSSVMMLSLWSPAFATEQAKDLGPDSRQFSVEFPDISRPDEKVVYSLANIRGIEKDLETLDALARQGLSERTAQEIVERLVVAIDLYAMINEDRRTHTDKRIELTSTLEGAIYQAFISLLRQRGEDRLNIQGDIPKRSLAKKLIEEMVNDVKGVFSWKSDGLGDRVYGPFEKLRRDQATQKVIQHLQEKAIQFRTVDDGNPKRALVGNSRDMILEYPVKFGKAVTEDRRKAQWAAVGTYGTLAVASFFVIIDYVGIVDGWTGGVGRSEMSELVTGIINFSILNAMAVLKAGSIRDHIRKMVYNLESLAKVDGEWSKNEKGEWVVVDNGSKDISKTRRSLAAIIFGKLLKFDRMIGGQPVSVLDQYLQRPASERSVFSFINGSGPAAGKCSLVFR